MKFTKELVNSYADKLLIGLTEEENKMVLDEFETIDKDIQVINQIPNIADVEPMSWCLEDECPVLNDDNVTQTPDINELLINAGEKMGREVEVVKVVG